MGKIAKIVLGMFLVIALAGTAAAVDLDALDNVTVLMSKSDVLSLIGKPDEAGDLGWGLKVDLYRMKDTDALLAAGCIYEDDLRLIGQAFIFQGEAGKEAAERIKQVGFILSEENEGAFRLMGKDDDTGQPLVVRVTQNKGLTIVMAFEKGFYDRRVKQAKEAGK